MAARDLIKLHGNRKREDLAGRRFGGLVVETPGPNSKWYCRCDCGRRTLSRADSLKRENGVLSCGCAAASSRFSKTHGKSNSAEFRVWYHMIQRCELRTHENYPMYGGRGIKVCDRWRKSFSAFLEDMGLRPSKSHSIDRIDPYKGYSPENCRWATCIEQCRNKTNNRILEFRGERKCLAEWSDETGIPESTIAGRLDRGWSVEDALSKPARKLSATGWSRAIVGRRVHRHGTSLMKSLGLDPASINEVELQKIVDMIAAAPAKGE